MMSALLGILISSAHAGILHKIPSKEKILETYNSIECQTCLLPNTFNLTVWNMYKGKKDSWYQDYHSLLDESDILLGQEFNLKDVMKDVLLNPTDLEVSLATSFISYKKYKTGVVTVSKYKSYDANAMRSRVREPFIRTPKLALATRYRLEDGRLISFINIHAINFVRKKKFKDQLKQVVEYIKEQNGPIVFAGDFNTNSKSKIKLMRKVLSDIGMKEASLKNSEDRMEWLGNKLDYIWYKGLDLVDATVRGEVEGSDHRPLQATFTVSNE